MSSFVKQRTWGGVLQALWEVSACTDPLAFGLKFVNGESRGDVGTFLLITNHLVIHIFLLG